MNDHFSVGVTTSQHLHVDPQAEAERPAIGNISLAASHNSENISFVESRNHKHSAKSLGNEISNDSIQHCLTF